MEPGFMGKRIGIAVLSLVVVLGPSASSTAQVNTTILAASLFDTYCLGRDGNFEDLGGRATDAHYKVVIERSIPMPNGAVMRQKNWLVPSGTGTSAPIMLTSNDVRNGSLHVFGCGIYGPELDGTAMESALSNLSRLGHPVKHVQVPGGSSVVTWLARVGEREPSVDTEVLLSRDTPSMPGVSVNLIFKTHLAEQSAAGHDMTHP
jgi:hypothetical protein